MLHDREQLLVLSGSRWLSHRLPVQVYIDIERQKRPGLVIYFGDCKSGADLFAWEHCVRHRIPFRRFEADWRTTPRKAGVIRNSVMVAAAREKYEQGTVVTFLGFFVVGKDNAGTHDAMAKCKRRSFELEEVWIDNRRGNVVPKPAVPIPPKETRKPARRNQKNRRKTQALLAQLFSEGGRAEVEGEGNDLPAPESEG